MLQQMGPILYKDGVPYEVRLTLKGRCFAFCFNLLNLLNGRRKESKSGGPQKE